MSNKTTVFDKKTKPAIKKAFTTESRPVPKQDSKFFTFNPNFYGTPITTNQQDLETPFTFLDTSPLSDPKQSGIELLKNKIIHSENPESDGISRKKLTKRARAKYYTLRLMEELLTLDSTNKKMYQRTKECTNLLKQEEQFLTSRYCQRRDCMVCNNIKTAQLIDRFKKPFNEIGETMFTTFHRPNIKADLLSSEITYFLNWFTSLRKYIQKNPVHGKKFSGIKRIEITYNHIMDTYNCHCHVGHTKGYERLILDKWIKDNPTCNPLAQHTTQTDQNTLTELMKYTTKFVSGTKKEPIVYVQAFDTIMSAIKGKRMISGFGELYNIKINHDESFEDLTRQKFVDLPNSNTDFWYYDESDWFNLDNQEPQELTGYHPQGINIQYIY
jgi:hypothetical protein